MKILPGQHKFGLAFGRDDIDTDNLKNSSVAIKKLIIEGVDLASVD